jgi:TolB-like protein
MNGSNLFNVSLLIDHDQGDQQVFTGAKTPQGVPGGHGLCHYRMDHCGSNRYHLPPSGKRKPFTSSLTIGILTVLLVGQFVYFGVIRKGSEEKAPNEIRKEKVAVAPLNNFTGQDQLSAFGLMASEWISSGLRELSIQTSSPEMMRKYRESVGILPDNPNQEVSLYELTGAMYVVTGSYYLKGDEIEVSSRLESTVTGEVIFDFPSLSGPLDQKETLVQEIRARGHR